MTHTKGVAPASQASVKERIRPISSGTLPKVPRRMAWRVRMLNQVSTWSSQDALVGVKWNAMRGWRASHACTDVRCRIR